MKISLDGSRKKATVETLVAPTSFMQSSGTAQSPMKPVVESQTRHRLTFSTTTAEANLKYPTCEETQDVENYQIFTKMSVSDRAGLKVKEDCCFRCLWPGHQGVNCERSERSGQEDSNGRHHFLLHGVTPQFPKRSVNTTTVSSNEDMYLES